MRGNVRALITVVAIATSTSLHATSARNIHPQLVGISTVALNVSPQNLPNLDADRLEQDVRDRVQKAGISVDRAGPVVLFVGITYQQIPACSDSVVVRTVVALSEEVPVRRGSRTESVYVDTWHESDDFIESREKAGERAHQAAVGLVKYLLDSAEYSRSVVEKKRD